MVSLLRRRTAAAVAPGYPSLHHPFRILSQSLSVGSDESQTPQQGGGGFRQRMKMMFKKYFFPASMIYGASYLSSLGAVYLAISYNVGAIVGLDYSTLLLQVTSDGRVILG